jgi:ABC-type antimicrobial peptide transport system permease subunit
LGIIKLIFHPTTIIVVLSIFNFFNFVVIDWWILVIGFIISLSISVRNGEAIGNLGDMLIMTAGKIDELDERIEKLDEKSDKKIDELDERIERLHRIKKNKKFV